MIGAAVEKPSGSLIVSAGDRLVFRGRVQTAVERLTGYGVVGEVTLGCMVGCGETCGSEGGVAWVMNGADDVTYHVRPSRVAQ